MIAATNIYSQLARFAECVYERGDIVEIRRLPSGRSTWHLATELPGIVDQLRVDNDDGQGVYVGINARKERGGKTTTDVVLARCLFADFDRTTSEQARERWKSAGLPKPTLTINSGHGVHAYWRLTEQIIDLPTWTRFQRDLAAVLQSDPNVHDPPRLARLPGFVNHKVPVADCIIIEADASRVYELAELHEHVPERPLPVSTTSDVTTNGNAVVAPRGLDVLARAARYAEKWESVGEGHRNASAVRHAAQLTHDFGLSDDAAWALLTAWNSKNAPPLEEGELRQCLANGREYGTYDLGCKADSPPPRQNGKKVLPTDSLPNDPGPDWYTIGDILKLPHYRHGIPPISTGYDALDEPLRGGLRPECVYVIAGRTGTSKSTLALNIARRVALENHCVLVFKLEESSTEAVWRIHAAAAQVPLNRLLDGAAGADDEQNRKLADAWELIHDLPIRISGDRQLEDIQRISRAHVESGGKLIVLDQISMVDVPHAQIGYEQTTAVSNALRHLARDLRVPILAVSQINRQASKGKDHLSVHDLRDSGQLENDAAAGILIDKVRKPREPHWTASELVRYLDIIIGKNRYGPTTDPERPATLVWWPAIGRIEDEPRESVGAERE